MAPQNNRLAMVSEPLHLNRLIKLGAADCGGLPPQTRARYVHLRVAHLDQAEGLYCGVFAAGSVNCLSQASFEPPLVMVAIKRDSNLHALIERSGAFAANILAANQKAVASAFFCSTEFADGKLNGYAFEAGPNTGAPLLVDLPAWFENRVMDVVKRGDHTVFVAEVIDAGLRDPDAKSMVLRDTGWS